MQGRSFLPSSVLFSRYRRECEAGTSLREDLGLGESLDLNPPVPNPTSVPSASQSPASTGSYIKMDLQQSWCGPKLDLTAFVGSWCPLNWGRSNTATSTTHCWSAAGIQAASQPVGLSGALHGCKFGMGKPGGLQEW